MRIFLITISVLFYINSFSQNLVYNGSFEEYSQCPDNLGQLTNVIGWFGSGGEGSSDYYNACEKTNFVSVPNNGHGYQKAKTGKAYAGFEFHVINGMSLEIAENLLIYPLDSGALYHIHLYVSNSHYSKYAIEDIGVYLGRDTITNKYNYNPQFVNTNGILYDTMNWINVSGTYTAHGGETIIAITNFSMHPHDSIVAGHNGDNSYYYIDDVAVYPSTAPVFMAECNPDTTICKGNPVDVSKTKVLDIYKPEYTYHWYAAGQPDDTLSIEENPVFFPDTTSTYVLKLTDFKFDVSYDTVTVRVVNCTEPTHCNVYPIPSTDQVTFEFNAPMSTVLEIDIFDVTGRLLLIYPTDINYETNKVKISLKGLASGMYLYRIRTEGTAIETGKFIKTN